jgi:tetraacyldisaccharide 4'-kinase
LYGGAIALRHLLFDEHILPKYEPRIPTICVGNLAVGGTGKTPMVEYLIRLLGRHGYKVGVLSRGYRRTTHGFLLATAAATAETIGDEPMQIHQKFPDVLVAVCEDRVKGIKHIQNLSTPPDVVLLDDAYQHRHISCGLTILLTAYDRLYVHDHLLPWGSLRDIPYRASKANIVVVTKCPPTMHPIDKRVVDSSLKLATFQHLYFSRVQYAPVQIKGIPLLLTSIARPEYLIDHVRGIEPQTEVLTYSDHHRFTPMDVNTILERAERYDCIVTTD